MAVNFPLTNKYGAMESYRENTYEVTNHGTDEIYFTYNLPWKFRCPGTFKEYPKTKSTKVNLRYRSTSMDYGEYPPTVHTVPLVYFPLITNFSREFTCSGSYRNYSLNTELDKNSCKRKY